MAPQHQDVPLQPHPCPTREALVPGQEEGEGSRNSSGAQTGQLIVSLRRLVPQETTPSVTAAAGVKKLQLQESLGKWVLPEAEDSSAERAGEVG